MPKESTMENVSTAAQSMERALVWHDIIARVRQLNLSGISSVYGVPRGGAVIAGLIHAIYPNVRCVDKPEDADMIVDDLIDSGRTMDRYLSQYPNKPFIGIYDKQTEKSLRGKWLCFPWEGDSVKDNEDAIVRVLEFIGEDPNREGLKETPKRYLNFLREFTSPPEFNFTTFDAEGTDEMIIQTNIPFFSLCEHHMAPFFGVGHIAYIPNDRIVGLSKLARTLDYYSRRLQNQERITKQVAERLMEELNPKGVAVTLSAQHLCMAMRGVKKHDTWTITSKMIGFFKDDHACRDEFLSLIR